MPERIGRRIQGLEQPAEIVVDRWGIAHIRAATARDVHFVQGVNAARDRLWQIDLWRKRGLGLLAADFGPGFLQQDRASRLFLYRGDMQAEWAAYGPQDTRAIVSAFVAGINAWVSLTEAEPDLLPPEFGAMGTRPAHWLAEDVVRIRSHGLVRNALSEHARARVIRGASTEADLARRSLEPAHDVAVPDGLVLEDLPDDLLSVFRLATAPVHFSPERLAARLEDAARWTRVTDLGEVTTEGSNNWAIGPARTASGRPILAGDPHRAHGLPSLRMIVHLTGPGIDIIGAGEPFQPGVSMGHNGIAAFGLTIFPMDQEDLYVHELKDERYRYGDGWEAVRVLREQIAVRGQADQPAEMAFSRHGPIIHRSTRMACALRTVWTEPGASPYLGALAYQNARTPDEFSAALAHWAAPSVNQVYADTSGHIGWFVAGRAPIRPNWDGLLPVPGDGRYEWSGFHQPDALPRCIDPSRGFVATANEMNLPPGFPADRVVLGYEWAERSRSDRIHAVLEAQPVHSLDQSMALQTDELSVPAGRLRALLGGIYAVDDDLDMALHLLRSWDGVLSRDSAAAALHEVWWSRHVKPALLDTVSTDPAVRALLAPGDTESLLSMLERHSGSRAECERLLTVTLGAAVRECRARLGEDPGTWAWGQLHHGYFEHPLSAVRDMRDVGPLAKGGSGSTVMAAGYRITDFRVTTGASFRMVLDVGDWDNSRVINAPGQSGDPTSPHYDDLAPLWAAGQYVPLLYDSAAIDAAAELVIRLIPE